MKKRSRAQVKTGPARVSRQRVASTPTTTERALVAMQRWQPNYGGMAASSLGAILWPDRTSHVIAQQGGGDYAAQMLLGRMRRAGLVRVLPGSGSSRWGLTGEGHRAASRATPGLVP